MLFYSVTHGDFSLEHAWIRSKGSNPEVMETLACVLGLRDMQKKQKILLDVMGFWGLSLETSDPGRNSRVSRKKGWNKKKGWANGGAWSPEPLCSREEEEEGGQAPYGREGRRRPRRSFPAWP